MKEKQATGYSQKPLSLKLGLVKGMDVKFIHPPDEYFQWLGKEWKQGAIDHPGPWDFVHLFVNRLDQLESNLFELRSGIKPAGMVWVSWFKKSAKKPTEITEDLIRDTCLPLGFVDVKVCAVSEEWSGLKLVIRKERR